jgi:hypothetical protein
MKQLPYLFLLLVSISINACSQNKYSTYNGKTWEQIAGNGRILKLHPPVAPFTKIELENFNADVLVETGAAQPSLNIAIDENLKGFFKWKQDSNTIKLSMDLSGGKFDRWLSSNNIKVIIKAPLIESVVNKGNGELEMNLQNQPAFSLVTYGNPKIKMKGVIQEFDLQSYGNADIRASNLITEKLTIQLNGNSDIAVNAKEVFEKSVSGNNEITNVFYQTIKDLQSDGVLNNETITPELISFRIKNNSLLPAKVTLISYRPDENGNGTRGFLLISLASKRFSFPIGTKIYLANSDQVNTVMSGEKITDQAPFLVVKKTDADKSFAIK